MKLLFFLLFSAAVLTLSAQKVGSKAYDVMLETLLSHSVPEVSVSDAQDGEYVFLDARAYDEYEISHIQGAIWVGFDDFKLSRIKDVPKNKELIVYCSVGYRSEKITERLKKEGYKASNLYGGIFEWSNQNKSIVNSQNKITDSVHVYSFSWGVWLHNGVKVY